MEKHELLGTIFEITKKLVKDGHLFDKERRSMFMHKEKEITAALNINLGHFKSAQETQAFETFTAPNFTSVSKESAGGVAQEITDDVALETTDDVALETTDDVALETTDNVALETTDDVALETTDDVALETTDDVALETTDDVALETTDDVAQETTDDVALETTDDVALETTDNVALETTDDVSLETTDDYAQETHENVDVVLPEHLMKKWEKIYKYFIKHGSLEDFSKTTLVNSKCAASKQLERDEVVMFMQGKVVSMDEGFTKYKVIGENYVGTLLFNLGRQFDFKWFSTEQYSATAQGKIVQSNVLSNCEIAVLNVNETPVPLIFATEQIQQKEPLCLSLTKVEKLNMEFLTWDQGNSKTEKLRRSIRVPSLGAFLEDLYEFHLENGTNDGVVKKYVSDEMGWGLFASKVFLPKQFIIEYQGKLLSEAAGRDRFENLPETDGSFLFYLGKTYENRWVDATENKEALGRFVNHSKTNFNTKVICRSVKGNPRIFLVATKNIQEGEQLTYDYNDRNHNFPFLYR